ncbi:hypothetical protein KCU62_g322, partial [Aureobasidium sp. EXF-3399]
MTQVDLSTNEAPVRRHLAQGEKLSQVDLSLPSLLFVSGAFFLVSGGEQVLTFIIVQSGCPPRKPSGFPQLSGCMLETLLENKFKRAESFGKSAIFSMQCFSSRNDVRKHSLSLDVGVMRTPALGPLLIRFITSSVCMQDQNPAPPDTNTSVTFLHVLSTLGMRTTSTTLTIFIALFHPISERDCFLDACDYHMMMNTIFLALSMTRWTISTDSLSTILSCLSAFTTISFILWKNNANMKGCLSSMVAFIPGEQNTWQTIAGHISNAGTAQGLDGTKLR